MKKILIFALSAAGCIIAAAAVIKLMPVKYDTISIPDSNISTGTEYQSTANILFIADRSFISSDCSTISTITDSAADIFNMTDSLKTNITVQICTFSQSTDRTSASFSHKLHTSREVNTYLSYIKEQLGKSDSVSDLNIPYRLAGISHNEEYSDSNFVFVFTDGSSRLREQDKQICCEENEQIKNLRVSYIIPSDSDENIRNVCKQYSSFSGGRIFDEYTETEGTQNKSIKLHNDICTYVKENIFTSENSNTVPQNESDTPAADSLSLNNDYIICDYPGAADSDLDSVPDICDPHPDSSDIFYDRAAVRQYALFSCTDPDNGTFRYLDSSNGDSATDCANFVSQCIYAGEYPMTDKWFMKKYSDSVPKIRRILDKSLGKATQIWSNYTGKSDGFGEYTEMEYLWTYPWTCAGVQSEYGKNYFFGDHLSVNDYESLKNTVLENNIQPGDVIYQGADRHHVVMITNVADDGTLFISSHNPVKYEEKLDETFWKRGGFSNSCEIFKVKDIIGQTKTP